MNIKTIKETKEDIRISVVMTVAGDINTTKRALESIDKYSQKSFELILIDGESHLEDIVMAFKNPNIKQIKIIDIGERVGYVKAMNMGIEEAKGIYIVICQNDIELVWNELDWLTMMERLMDTHPEFGAVGPVTSTRHPKLFFNDSFAEPNDFMFGFQCVMIRRKVFEDIGYIDENFTNNGGYDDDDFFLRLKTSERWKLGITFFGVKHHYNEGYARQIDAEKAVLNARSNYTYFNQKWEHAKLKRGDKLDDDNTAGP